jgi:hypothetical protein
MRSTPADPNTLDAEAVNLALYCVETIVRFRAYTSGAILVMLLGKFRDDIRAAHRIEPLLPPQRGSQHLPLRELTPSELDAVIGAVGTLLDQFEPFMDDPGLPALLRDFQDVLKFEVVERTKPREGATADARVS